MKVDAVLIAGPTASGKSAAAVALAERLSGVVVNADSMQVYRDASILTARPPPAEEARAPHRLYGHVSAAQSYSVARYLADAAGALAEARTSGHLPIVVGGTGLYFDALTQGIADIPPVPAEIRAEAVRHRAEIGAEAFHAELAARDPEAATRLRPSDAQRVLRAYEVFEATGRPLSAWQRASALPAPLANLTLKTFVVTPARGELHRRIDARFAAMLERGALAEAAQLKGLDPSKPAAKILGLRELLAVLEGALSLDEARIRAQAASRQYAKRQLTWFRHRMNDWTWIDSTESNYITEMLLSVE